MMLQPRIPSPEREKPLLAKRLQEKRQQEDAAMHSELAQKVGQAVEQARSSVFETWVVPCASLVCLERQEACRPCMQKNRLVSMGMRSSCIVRCTRWVFAEI